jgi:hypothetical protein
VLQAKYVSLEIFSKLVFSGTGSCEFGNIDENRFVNGMFFWEGYFLSLHRGKYVSQDLQFNSLSRDQDIYQVMKLSTFLLYITCQKFGK